MRKLLALTTACVLYCRLVGKGEIWQETTKYEGVGSFGMLQLVLGSSSKVKYKGWIDAVDIISSSFNVDMSVFVFRSYSVLSKCLKLALTYVLACAKVVTGEIRCLNVKFQCLVGYDGI